MTTIIHHGRADRVSAKVSKKASWSMIDALTFYPNASVILSFPRFLHQFSTDFHEICQALFSGPTGPRLKMSKM